MMLDVLANDIIPVELSRPLVVEISELCDGEISQCGDIPFGNCSVSSDGKRIQYTPPTNLEYVGLLEKCSYPCM